jgi:hypothetical protein
MQQLNAPGVRWEWISEAWNLFTKQWSAWVLMTLVMYLILIVVYVAVYLPLFGMILAAATTAPRITNSLGTPMISLITLVAMLVIYTVVFWLYGGLYNSAFKQLRGERIAVGNLFSGGKYLARMLGVILPLMIVFFISYLISPLLYLALLIPALILLGPALFIFPMIVEGGMGTIDAIKASVEVAKRDWIMFTLFFIVLGLIAGAGVLACGFGLLATVPLLFLGQALAYRDCVGMHGAQMQGQFMPPPPPPDYRDYAQAQTPAQPPAPAQPQAQAWAPPPNYGSAPAPESAAKTCPHCGATLARAVNFCNQCGRPLRGA